MIDPTFKVTKDGISAPSYADILDFYKEKAKGIFGNDINLAADTQDGQLIAIFARAVHDVNSQAIATYNQFNPHTASGVGLDSAVKTNGIRRRDATKSQATLTLVGQEGAIIQDGIAIDTNENRWVLPDYVIIPREGEIEVTAVAEKVGDVTAPAGSITKIGTPTRGWQSVTNKRPAIPGVAVEVDADLKRRQAQSTMISSVSIWDGIIGSLMALEGVIRVSGRQNDTDTQSKDGIPAHSIALVVDGGDVQEIATTLFRKKGPGTGTYGDVSETYIDKFGGSNVIKFSRSKVIEVHVKVTVKPEYAYTTPVADEIKARVVDYINSLPIGDDVGIARVLSAASMNNCAIDTRFNVDGIQMGKRSNGLSVASIPIAWNEVAHCSAANVQVEVRRDFLTQ